MNPWGRQHTAAVLLRIRATQDHGCLIFGSRYDFQGSGFERDIYAYKVDQNGLITGTDDKPNPRVHQAIVYPNPGSDYLIVETGPQVAGSCINLIDMNGKTLLNRIICDEHVTIHTQDFPVGTYLWEILDGNKVIEQGKWIKRWEGACELVWLSDWFYWCLSRGLRSGSYISRDFIQNNWVSFRLKVLILFKMKQ